MAEVKESLTKQLDKHNTGNQRTFDYLRMQHNRKLLEEAPVDTRPPVSAPFNYDTSAASQPPPRPPLNRVDSRSSFAAQPLNQQPRQLIPNQPQLRPQFQPGGPVTSPPQFAPRPGTSVPRGPLPPGPPGPQQTRPPPVRPFGPQSFTPAHVPRALQSPTSGQPPQRAPPPNSLQFGPRQPSQIGGTTTPEAVKPITQQQLASVPRPILQQSSPQATGQNLRGSSQVTTGLPYQTNTYNKTANLDNQSINIVPKPENGVEIPAMAKGRSFSIAAAPGAPSPLKMEDDRRKSISALGGKQDEYPMRNPALGLIQEGRADSRENMYGSKESVRSVASNEGGKNVTERPESRVSAAKMSDSFIGTLSTMTPQRKLDDDDDVILHNNAKSLSVKNNGDRQENKYNSETTDRSPSLTRSKDSQELKHIQKQSTALNNTQNIYAETQPPKSCLSEVKQELKMDQGKTPQNKTSACPIPESKPPIPIQKKQNESPIGFSDFKKTVPIKTASAPKSRQQDGDNDSGVDETTQGNDVNGSPSSPNKRMASKLPTKEKSSNSLKPSLSRSSSKSATVKTPESPQPIEKKKVPMNKIQVGNAPSPNIKAVKSKIGSLDNATYKPGGGRVKIENRKLEFGNVTPRIAAKNDTYAPSGGTKKITTAKLEWNAKSKIGSLQNTAYKPGGGDKKIETVKLDFKEKAKPKVASTVNITHKPGGGAVKIENQKLEFKAQSKVGSMDNVKHKPGGGEVKIFDDKDYIKQMSGVPLAGSHNHSRQEDFYGEEWEEDRPMSRCRSARAPLTPRTPRALSPRKHCNIDDDRIIRNNERNRRASIRPASARDLPRSGYSRRIPISQRPAFTVY